MEEALQHFQNAVKRYESVQNRFQWLKQVVKSRYEYLLILQEMKENCPKSDQWMEGYLAALAGVLDYAEETCCL